MARRRVIRWLGSSIWADRLLALFALSPLGVLIVRQTQELDNRVIPCCDFGALELGTRAFLRGEQLLGLYSREGWRHPGPGPFMWSSLFRPLPGQSFAEHQVAMAVLACVVLSLVVGLTWNRVSSAGRSLTIVLISVFILRFGVEWMRVPWNPYMATMWTLLTVTSTAVFAQTRSRSSAAIAVAAGSMAAQSHVGSAPTVAVCFLVIAIVLIRHRHRRDSIRTGWIAGGIVSVLWFLPFADLFFGNHNAAKILTTSSSTPAPMDTSDVLTGTMWILGNSPGTIGASLGPSSPFIAARSIIWLDVVAVVLVLGLALVAMARIRRDRFAGSMAALVVVSGAGTVVALMISNGPFYRYLLLPIAGLGLIAWISAGLSTLQFLHRYEHRGLKIVAWPVVLALTTASILGLDGRRFTDEFDSTDVNSIVDQLRDECTTIPERAVVLVDEDVQWFEALSVLVPIERCAELRVVGHIGFVAGQPYQAGSSDAVNMFVTLGREVPDARVVAWSDSIVVSVADA